MSDMIFEYVVVDHLPHGLAAARRLDPDGGAITYISRAASHDQLAAALAGISQEHSDLYDRVQLAPGTVVRAS